jgi:NAD(P)-dependent dehydrogenase (short-subunit alcohol dehydrogenase family)
MTGGQQSRVVFITGASSGIGRACAEHLSRVGWRVYGGSRSAPETPASAGGATLLRVDVTSDESVQAALRAILDREGRLDAVINNAGVGFAGAAEETPVEEARVVWETNFLGAVRVCQQALPSLRASGGCVVNISSLGGIVALPFQAMYSASKFALEGYTEALRAEVRECGVRVVLVEPGDFRTGFTARRRVATASAESSPYRAAFARALPIIERNEQQGSDPALLARRIERILCDPAPRLRHRVGTRLELLLMKIRDWLPAGGAEWAMRRYYGLG